MVVNKRRKRAPESGSGHIKVASRHLLALFASLQGPTYCIRLCLYFWIDLTRFTSPSCTLVVINAVLPDMLDSDAAPSSAKDIAEAYTSLRLDI